MTTVPKKIRSAKRDAFPVAPASMPVVAKVDKRYQSYNVEMAEVVGGRFWKAYDARDRDVEAGKAPAPATASAGPGFQIGGADPNLFQSRPPVDLSNGRLRALAAALGPAFVRVSGTWANSVYFHDADGPPPAEAPPGFQNVLTREEWRGVIDFARAAGAQIVTSFAISAGVRDAQGVWTPVQAKPLLAFTRDQGGSIAAAELFNEPTLAAQGGAPPGYDAAMFARDEAVFRSFMKHASPGTLIAGPGSAGEGVSLVPASMPMLTSEELLSAEPRPVFDIFSYHFYGAASERCASIGEGVATTSPGEALSDEWLSLTDQVCAFYESLRDRFEPGKPIWLTETADAACGGNPWAVTFLDSFRYLNQLGSLAKRGVQAVFHNTLAASEYGLIDQAALTPRPNYWAALLWSRLMGETVFDAGFTASGLHLYAHSLRGHPGGVALLAINANPEATERLDLPMPSERFTLTARDARNGSVQLNGRDLGLSPDGTIPTLQGDRVGAGQIDLAPASITFLSVPGAGNARA